jgi:hypothetical protein
MLAVDELALRVAKNDSATALSRHDPVGRWNAAAPARSQTATQTAEVNSLLRSVKTASTSATTRWQGELWAAAVLVVLGGGEHSEGTLLPVAVVAGSWRDRPARMRPCRRGSISLVER